MADNSVIEDDNVLLFSEKMSRMNIDKTIDDIDIINRVTKKQIDLLYENQSFALISTVLIIALFFGLISLHHETSEYIIQLGLFSVAIFYRFYNNWYFFKKKNNNAVDYKKAEYLYSAGTIMTAVIWGYVLVTLFPIIDLKLQILLFLIVMGLEAASHSTMGFRRLPILSFILILVFPLIYAVYISGFLNIVAITVAICVHTVFMFKSAITFYNSTYDMLRLNEVAAQREQNLIIQTAKANSANTAKSEFLSRMSHELRTPLNAILGMNELLLLDKKEALTYKQRERSLKVSEAGKHLLGIVDDVLDMSRIESGSIDINLELTNCLSVVEESIKLVEDKANKRDISFRVGHLDSDIYVRSDSKRLKQVIVNLLDNAVKYNKHNGTVTVLIDVNNKETVRISIIDTGYGISEDCIDDLYTPFSRLGAETLGIDGTGIGLSLCKQLIEQMKGEIGVNNSKGKGCCFWVELPYIEIKEASSQYLSMDRAGENIAHTMSAAGKSRILLVEDNLVNCEVAIDMLGELGFDIDVVNNGQEALDSFEPNKYNLILMDCEMPVMDGFTATGEIRKRENDFNHTVPIIALTAHAVTGAKDKCLASGMDDFLSKPFTMKSLNNILKKWLADADFEKTTHSDQTNDTLPVLQQEQGADQQSVQLSSQANGEISPVVDNNQDAILDQSVIDRLCSRIKPDGSNLADKVFKVYLEQSAKLLDELSSAHQQADLEAIRSIAHALKSSSNNVGATSLSLLCAEVERTCERGQLENELVNNIYKLYSDVESALNALLPANKSAIA